MNKNEQATLLTYVDTGQRVSFIINLLFCSNRTMAEWMFIFEVSKRAIFLLNNASECTSIFNQKSNNKQDKERYFLDHKPHFPSHYGASKHTKENQEIAVLLSPFLEIKFNGKFSNCSRKYQMIGSFQILWQVYWLDFAVENSQIEITP